MQCKPVVEPPRTLGSFWTLESMTSVVTTFSRVRPTRVRRTLSACPFVCRLAACGRADGPPPKAAAGMIPHWRLQWGATEGEGRKCHVLTYVTYALSQSERVLRQKLMSEVILRRLKFKLKEVITFIIN